MKPIILSLLICSMMLQSCDSPSSEKSAFVKVDGAQFVINGKPYYYLGTNFWYGLNLGSPGEGGDRERLVRELDKLKELGITNLRIVGASEGPDDEPYRMLPSSQPAPREYNEEVLKGLDFLLSEMGKRNMYAVVTLNNFWPWSGGMAQYLAWNGASAIPYPPPHPDGEWDTYQKYTSQFYTNEKAVAQFNDYIKMIVNRKNTVTGVNYKDDPAIMAWQLCNEPRGLTNADAFNQWIDETAGLIKSLDPNHLVSAGTEGETPWPDYAGLDVIRNHEGKNIDYVTGHIWIENWGWYDPSKHDSTYGEARQNMVSYLSRHIDLAKQLNKPFVLEEFGIARDMGDHDPAASATKRDIYYSAVFDEIYKAAKDKTPVAGANFWAWGGEGRPREPHTLWKKGDPFIGDPPHEFQGWYSVYDKDASTHQVIAEYAKRMNELK